MPNCVCRPLQGSGVRTAAAVAVGGGVGESVSVGEALKVAVTVGDWLGLKL